MIGDPPEMRSGRSRNRGKHAVPETARPVGIVFGAREVLQAVQDSETRSYARSQYRGSGPWALADCLTHTEDWLELRYSRRDRTAIRELRRRLEDRADRTAPRRRR